VYNLIINLFSYNNEATTINKLSTFNQVVAWSLRKAFKKIGVETRFVSDTQFCEEDIPEADHSIVISSFVASEIRAISSLRKKIRDATRGKLTFYLDSDYSGWLSCFDYILTVIPPVQKDPRYVYAGWGADPEFFYPEQEEKAVFIDCLMYGYYQNKFDHYYDTIAKTFQVPIRNLLTGHPLHYKTKINGKKITVYMPLPTYRKKKKFWHEMQKILRKCHYYVCTQLGESGLTRIESATCGALLVVATQLYRHRTMDYFEHVIWETKQELSDIVMMETDPKAISQKALEQSWDNAATRIIKCFEG